MALSEGELKRIENAMAAFMEKRRPPVHIRDKVDLAYRIENQSVFIFEIRPHFKNPDTMLEIPISKATYVRTIDKWEIYWQRKDLKWHVYDPDPEVDTIEEVLAIVARDEYACFFG